MQEMIDSCTEETSDTRCRSSSETAHAKLKRKLSIHPKNSLAALHLPPSHFVGNGFGYQVRLFGCARLRLRLSVP